jgi:cell division protease FtsH
MDRKKVFRSWWPWTIGLLVLFALFVVPSIASTSSYTSVNTSVAIAQIQSGNVIKAVMHDKEQTLDLDLKAAVDGHSKISTSYPADGTASLYNQLTSLKENFTTKVSRGNPWLTLLETLFPFLLIGVVLFIVMSQVQGGGSRVMSFGRSKAKLVSKDTPKTTFADVAGADEAVEELLEIKEFLANPAKFQAIGAKIPKGVLLYGPPGTGKTLLARAVAGEAGVPFYAISGSDFVEMFVGVGASRVRDLFEQAKANAPAIVFVDEIDAVGRHRGAGMGGGHDEREQTLNQLLVEMDGFDVKGGVILIAATNRPDILDPALLRPGRFDRQIAVGAPDVLGREAVLKVHAKGKPFAQDVDLGVIARRTPGFTGADLANVINEAALLTARNNGRLITNESLEESIDRVIAGPERKTRAMSDKEKRVTAYHEAGHALTAWAMPNLDPVHKVTILPRGRSLGHTLVLPVEDRYTQTRSEILDQLVYALGGRAAEELVFHEPTTGASNDIEKATALARAMVVEYGMSSKLGAVKYGTSDSEPFMGRDYGHQRDYSEDVAADIDAEVRNLIEGAHDEAWEILVQYRDVLDQMVLELAEKETLAKDDLERILAPVRKRPPHNSFSGFGKRTPSDRPPIEIPPSLRRASGANGANSATNGGANGGYPNGSNGWNEPAPAGAVSNAATGQPGPFGAAVASGGFGNPTAYGQPQPGQPQPGQPQYGQPQYGQPQNGQPQNGQPQYGQPQYGQPAYGTQPPYGGQAPYGAQPDYGQPDYGQPGASGEFGVPSTGSNFAPPTSGQPPYPTSPPNPERSAEDPDGGRRDTV